MNFRTQDCAPIGDTEMGPAGWRRSAWGCASLAALTTLLLLAGCSFFRASQAPADGAAQGQPPAPEQAKDPRAEGVLNAIGFEAPVNSPAQFLARIANDLGWESQVAQNAPLRKAVENKDFDKVVLPYLLSLFYRNGFSVLPRVGEGHQFARDSIVRGVTGTSRLLVTTREPLKLIFLGAVENVQIIYPQDGQSPQIFTLTGTGVVAVRRSQLEQYLQ